MDEAFAVMILAPSGGRLRWVAYAHHAGKELGAVIAHGGGVMPPGRCTCAEEEPEDAGGAAMKKDVLHGWCGAWQRRFYRLKEEEAACRRDAEESRDKCRRSVSGIELLCHVGLRLDCCHAKL